MQRIILIAHNLRSCHNVGALLRTADGLGIEKVFLTGYTPYPAGRLPDVRLPHLAQKINKQIAKTALGAERSLAWDYAEDVFGVLVQLQSEGWLVAALEQAPGAIILPLFQPIQPMALVVGREVEGVEAAVIAACDMSIEIPMFGQKESFNVAVAGAMALYHLRFVAN